MAATPTGEVKVFKLVAPHNASEFHYKAYLSMIDEIQKESKGKIKIDLFASETLVKVRATPEAVQQGIADMGYIVLGYHQAMFPLSDVWSLPMVFTNAVQGWQWDVKLKVKFWNPAYEKAGLVCLGKNQSKGQPAKELIEDLKKLGGGRAK